MAKLKLKPKIKQLWVSALRSGDYEKGRGHLCKEGTFCCLGVLCETLYKSTNYKITKEKDIFSYGINCVRYVYVGHGRKIGGMCHLPENLLRTINMDADTENSLIGLNDTKRWSFKKIAAYIERYL